MSTVAVSSCEGQEVLTHVLWFIVTQCDVIFIYFKVHLNFSKIERQTFSSSN